MKKIKRFSESISKKSEFEEIEDYFLYLVDQKKWNIKIVKSPNIYKKGYTISDNLYPGWAREATISKRRRAGEDAISKKGGYMLSLTLKNEIFDIKEMIDEISKVCKRHNLLCGIHSLSIKPKNIIEFRIDVKDEKSPIKDISDYI